MADLDVATLERLQRKRPGFFFGAAQVFAALRFIVRNPDTWPMAIVPALLFLVLGIAGTVFGIVWLTPWVLSLLSSPNDFWMTAAHWLVRFLMYAASLIIGMWTALLVTPPLSAPALEHLVALQERELLVRQRTPMGFFAELMCGLKAQLLAVCFAAPLVFALWIVEFVIPPSGLITAPLQALVTAFAIAWNLFDYPLTLRGVPASDRLGLVVSNLKALLGFGLAFAALFWIPCFGVLMLPVGAVAATRLLYALLESDPRELPTLPRPTPTELRAPGLWTTPGSADSLGTAPIGRKANDP